MCGPQDSGRGAGGIPAPVEGRTVVLGLGNPVVQDDRAGLAVASALSRLLACAPVPGVDVLVSTRAGFELIDLLQGYARAILVDALTISDPQPGRVRRLSLDAVAGSARLINSHEISIGQAFRLAERLGIVMPKEVTIYAIETADTTTIGEGPTPAVAAAIAPLAQLIHDSLRDSAPPIPPPDTPEFQRRREIYAPE